MSEASFRFDVGRLLCGAVRDYLEAEKMLERIECFHEGGGWLERTFTVGGSREQLERIRAQIMAWSQQVDSK